MKLRDEIKFKKYVLQFSLKTYIFSALLVSIAEVNPYPLRNAFKELPRRLFGYETKKKKKW